MVRINQHNKSSDETNRRRQIGQHQNKYVSKPKGSGKGLCVTAFLGALLATTAFSAINHPNEEMPFSLQTDPDGFLLRHDLPMRDIELISPALLKPDPISPSPVPKRNQASTPNLSIPSPSLSSPINPITTSNSPTISISNSVSSSPEPKPSVITEPVVDSDPVLRSNLPIPPLDELPAPPLDPHPSDGPNELGCIAAALTITAIVNKGLGLNQSSTAVSATETKEVAAAPPSSRPIEKQITIGRRQYTIKTELPLETSDEQVAAFVETFKAQILAKIVRKEGFDATQNFTVSFPEDTNIAFAVTTVAGDERKDPISFEMPQEAAEKQKLVHIREILSASLSILPKSDVEKRLQICWKTLQNVREEASQPLVEPSQPSTKTEELPPAIKPLPRPPILAAPTPVLHPEPAASKKDINPQPPVSTTPSPKPKTPVPSVSVETHQIPSSNIPLGMKNTGNLCWAISTLQLVLSSKILPQWISGGALMPFEQGSTAERLGAPLRANLIKFNELYQKENESKPRITTCTFAVDSLRSTLSQWKKEFKTEGIQYDVTESLGSILELVPEEFKGVYREQSTQYFNSEVHEDFEPRETPFSIIALSIPKGEKKMQTMIDSFFIDIADSPIEQLRVIKKAPQDLWFSIKRFDKSDRKIIDKITLAHEVTITLEDGNTKKYKLQAMTNHIGSTKKSGHYTTERWVGDQCYLCDDATVTLMPKRKRGQDIVSSQAYLLHYELVS